MLRQTARSISRMKSVLLFVLLVLAVSIAMQAQVPLTQISSDPFTNSIAQHATEVEAATWANGNTIVSIFQQGRFFNGGGSSDNGWATSQDGGVTWQHGSLPGLTKTGGGGIYDRATDPAIIFDVAHGVWLAASLPLLNRGAATTAELISRSVDGINWDNPVTVSRVFAKPDKTWVSCDNNSGSPFFGHCYAEWDNNAAGDLTYLAVSTDGGLTWSNAIEPATNPAIFGAQPLAQPGGLVIAPGADAFDTTIQAFTSSDGGGHWTPPVVVSSISDHHADGGLRDLVLPTSAMDAAGRVFTVWQDCRFRSGCAENDLVMSTSTDGVHWSAVTRIPIDPTSSTVDHFLPGLAIEPGTSGTTAHLGVTYYFYPTANCTKTTCQLEEGYIASTNGGTSWTAPTTVAGAMTLTWFPNTNQGFMPGDYESLAFVNGLAFPVLAVATAPSGTTFNVTMQTPTAGLSDAAGVYTSAGETPVPNAHSDHAVRTTPICDRCEHE